MAFITKLPAEIVHQILNSFKHDKATLCQLSLASSFFAPVAQQILLKHLVLSVDISLTGTETPFDQIIKKFDETPHLSAHVQTLVLSSRHKCNESLNSIKRALEILNRVTSLKSLHLKNTLMLPRWDISAPTSGSFLERNPLTRLTKLNLKSPWISWDGLATLLYLPKLEHLSLGYLPPGQLPSTLSECRVKFCRIKTLELGSWRGGPDLPLRTLLELTNGLEVLSLSIETATQLNSRRLTPSGVNEALVPVRNTLKALSIIDLCGEDAIVGSRLDLSEFKKLEKVEVSSALFFVSPTDGRLRDGLYKLLPRSLVELQINLAGEDAIIESMPNPSAAIEQRQVNWISELAIKKSNHYPEFCSLILQERVSPQSRRALDHLDPSDYRKVPLPEGSRLELEASSIALRCCMCPITSVCSGWGR